MQAQEIANDGNTPEHGEDEAVVRILEPPLRKSFQIWFLTDFFFLFQIVIVRFFSIKAYRFVYCNMFRVEIEVCIVGIQRNLFSIEHKFHF